MRKIPIMKKNSLIYLLHKSRPVFCQSILTLYLLMAPLLCTKGLCLWPPSSSPLQPPLDR